MNEDIQKLHAESKMKYPKLKLEDDEYVIYAFRRVRIHLTTIGITSMIGLILTPTIYAIIAANSTLDEMGKNFLGLIFIVIAAVIFIATIFATMLHFGNKLFVTNNRVMQFSMLSPFSTSYNVIDLSSIEDVSFHQTNILQKIFGFGTLRLATVGDETTYTLKYTIATADQINKITRLVSDDKDRSK